MSLSEETGQEQKFEVGVWPAPYYHRKNTWKNFLRWHFQKLVSFLFQDKIFHLMRTLHGHKIAWFSANFCVWESEKNLPWVFSHLQPTMNWLKSNNLSCAEHYVFNVALNISTKLRTNVNQIFSIFVVLFVKRAWFTFEVNYCINSVFNLY